MNKFVFERRCALLTAVAIVALIGYLVIRNEPFRDENLVLLLRIVLALATGILGATIPGFLQISYSMGGFAIRAAGALALFVITYFGTPQVKTLGLLPEARVDVYSLRQIDFRSALGPEHDDSKRKLAKVYATIPVSLRNSAQPGKTATLERTGLHFRLNDHEYKFTWRNFVTMHEERYGLWLGIDGDAVPVSIEPGKTINLEILHEPIMPTNWGAILEDFTRPDIKNLEIMVEFAVDQQLMKVRCSVDLAYWRSKAQNFMDKNHRVPGRITMNCLGVDRG